MTKQIIKTDYLDVFRIRDGVLFKVYKCKTISHMYCDYNKRKCEKIAENIYKIKTDINISWRDIDIMPAGSVIVEGSWVEQVTDYSKFRFELKTTADCFGGDIKAINRYLTAIDNILASYM